MLLATLLQELSEGLPASEYSLCLCLAQCQPCPLRAACGLQPVVSHLSQFNCPCLSRRYGQMSVAHLKAISWAE